jgi:hypothetical protein
MTDNDLIYKTILKILELEHREEERLLSRIDKDKCAVFLNRSIYEACRRINDLYQINPLNLICNTFMGYKVYFIDTEDVDEVYLGRRCNEQ